LIVFSEYPSADASYQIATPLVRATNLLLLIKIFLSTEDRFGIDECANRQAICACADLPRPVLRGLRAELIILGCFVRAGVFSMSIGLLTGHVGQRFRTPRFSKSSLVGIVSLTAFFLATHSTSSFAQGMVLPGSASVSGSGAATYNIPIVAPSGTAGMSPSIGLSYNSQGGNNTIAGNGIVGMGWSLDGLPSIMRCGRTVVQDGVYGGVNYDANDRFCMDGQRLMVISGTYGADGAEYRTEIETFSRIISHGTAGVGPAWFEVHTKTGQVMEFGNTTDSRILAQGKTVARSWAVDKVSDTKGNYFTVTYVNDNANGQAYPSRIDYTGNVAASLAPYNSVQFVYNTSRPDITPAYHQGSVIQTKVLLTNVKTYAGVTWVGDYRLAYQQGTATGRSQLASVTLCDGSGVCLPPTTFTWQNGASATTSVISNPGSQNGTLTGSVPYIADFNGDGLADIMWDAQGLGTGTTTGTRVLWTGTGAGNFTVNSNFANQNGTLSGYAPIIADFNRDGRPDILWAQGTNLFAGPASWWNSNAFGGYAITGNPSLPFHGEALAIADMNGDSRPDLLMFMDPTKTFSSYLTGADGSLTAVASGITPPAAGADCRTSPKGIDLNGDGILDTIVMAQNGGGCSWNNSNGTFAIYLGNGDGTFHSVAGADASVAHSAMVYLDINGDGKTDILWVAVDSNGLSTGNRIAWISKGDGTFTVVTNPSGTNGTLIGYVPYAADFNGDGKGDILWVQTDTNGLASGAHVAWIGKGDGTFTVVSNFAGQDGQPPYTSGTPAVGYVPLLADFNGDGKTDVFWDKRQSGDNRSQGTRVLWLSDGLPPDVITSVTNGLGVTTSFTYKSGTDASVYTKEATAQDPVIDIQGAMQLVSQISGPDGAGGTKNVAYSYAGGKVDQNGRGYLGFHQVVTTDLQTNVVQTQTYRQDYPYTGFVASDIRKLGSLALNWTINFYGSNNLGGTRSQVFLSRSQIASNDLDGTPLPTATSTFQYDAFGNTTQIVVSHSDGYIKTTTNTYTNDAVNWYLGRLTRASVTSQAP